MPWEWWDEIGSIWMNDVYDVYDVEFLRDAEFQWAPVEDPWNYPPGSDWIWIPQWFASSIHDEWHDHR